MLLALAALRGTAQAQSLIAPRLSAEQDTQPPYPAGAADPNLRARLVLELLIDAQGHVSEARPVEVEMEPTGAEPQPFVQSALEHARQLRFEPASRDGQPAAARVRLALHIPPDSAASTAIIEPPAQPDAPPPPVTAPARSTTAAAAPSSVQTAPAPQPAFGARAQLAADLGPERASAASDFDLELGALRAVPRRAAQDYLTLAPGVVLANHSGIGHAASVYLRGFDAGEGQDIEFSVDGMPINEPSNPHGHGYADTQFVIPEVVERVHVLEGPFDPRQSDFAVAGSVAYELGMRERGIRAQVGYGSFDEQRALLSWAPTAAEPGTFAALDLRRGDGFGPNRAHSSMSALARYAGSHGPVRYSVLFGSHAASFDSAGVLRQDSFEARQLPCASDPDSQFFCTVDPHQGGAESRHLLNARLALHKPDRSYQLQVFGTLRGLHIREDYTGALLDPRGDGLDEGYQTGTLGARAAYTLTPRLWQRKQRFELGLDARHDAGNTRMWRLRRDGAVPYATLFDRDLALTHVGAYVRAELAALPWLSVLGGARVDGFAFNTLNKAAPSSDREGPRLPQDARDAWGSALSPRGSLVFHLARSLDWTASAGLGVRSSDAQALSEGEAAPFARVLSLETGPSAVFSPRPNLKLEARAFAFATRVENDLLFDAERGRNVPVGPSNRFGASASARARFGTSHDTLFSLTWTEARKSERASGLFALGSGPRLPFVPRMLARLDHASNARLRVGPEVLQLGAALGLGWIGPRPLPLATESESVWQLDVALRARLRFLEIGVALENLFDVRNHAAELNYPSHFGSADDPLSMRSERHFAAGPPRLWMLTLTAYVDDVIDDAGDAT